MSLQNTSPNMSPFTDAEFRKSDRSSVSECVEVARNSHLAAIRDSKNRSSTTLFFAAAEWKSFIGGVKNDET